MIDKDLTKQTSKNRNRLLGGCFAFLFLFIEVLLIILFLTVNYGYRHDKSILNSGIAIQATVVKAIDAHKENKKHVELRYTVGDIEYFHTELFNDQLGVGDSTELTYDPTNPFHASLPGEVTENSVRHIWVISLFFLGAAIAWPIIAAAGVVRSCKFENPNPTHVRRNHP